MKKHILFAIVILCVVATVCISGVYADTKAPESPYSIVLENGDKIFYMTPKGMETGEQLRSGLYYNTEPPEVIYYAHF